MSRGPGLRLNMAEASSRICVAIALVIALVSCVLSFSSAKAADDGDCCSNLEDRIANLESKADKGNEKVSVTVSGWIEKSATHWSDGGGQDLKPSAGSNR